MRAAERNWPPQTEPPRAAQSRSSSPAAAEDNYHSVLGASFKTVFTFKRSRRIFAGSLVGGARTLIPLAPLPAKITRKSAIVSNLEQVGRIRDTFVRAYVALHCPKRHRAPVPPRDWHSCSSFPRESATKRHDRAFVGTDIHSFAVNHASCRYGKCRRVILSDSVLCLVRGANAEFSVHAAITAREIGRRMVLSCIVALRFLGRRFQHAVTCRAVN